MNGLRQLQAIVFDSLREARARKAFWVLLVLGSLVIAFCAGVGFEERTAQDALTDHIEVALDARVGSRRITTDSDYTSVLELAPTEEALGVAGRFRVNDPDRLEGAVLSRRGARTRFNRSPWAEDQDAESETDTSPSTEEERLAVLRQRIEEGGWFSVEVRSHAEANVYEVEVVGGNARRIGGLRSHFLFFGAVEISLDSSESEVMAGYQVGISNGVLGFFGMIILILTSAGFIPSMLQKGTLDLVLARPLSRWRLLLYKYLGGLWLVLFMAAYTVGGCWLALALRSGYWNAAFLWAIPIGTLSFAVLYAIVALMGVLTRSGTVAALVAFGTWMISSLIGNAVLALKALGLGEEGGFLASLPSYVKDGITTLYWILPKMEDFGLLNQRLLSEGQNVGGDAAERLMPLMTRHLDFPLSIGSSVLFAVVMLALACRVFSRRDW